MRRYLNADLHRITLKKSFIILMLLEFAAAAGFSLLSISGRSSGYKNEISSCILFMPLYLGTFLYHFVLSEDFRAGTMQTAIGRGMTRPAAYLTKFVEIALLGAFNAAIVCAILIYVPALAGTAVKITDIRAILLPVIMAYIRILSCSAIGMMFLYGGMNEMTGFGVYLMVSSGMVQSFLNDLTGRISVGKSIGKRIAAFTLSGLTSSFCEKPGGNILPDLLRLAGMAAYVAVPLLIGIFLFSKRELD